MAASAVERFRRWFEYEVDAHAKVLASLSTVPAGNRSSPEFHKAVEVLGHIAAARQMWLFRFGVADRRPDELFPRGLSLEGVAGRLREVHAAWADYLGRLTDGELDRVFEYQSWEGQRFRNRVEDILTQLFGHSWYHRGQIASLVRAAGGEPAVTDFVFWCREPIPPAGA